MDAAKDVHISRETFLRSIVPIGLLFSGSLILSNKAYLYLSVHYIQMLKAFNPVAILLIMWAFRIKDINKKLALIVLMISTGVALTSKGELRFDLTGFVIQAAAVAVRVYSILLVHDVFVNCTNPVISFKHHAL